MSKLRQSVEDIYYAALEQPDAAQRRAFVDESCAGLPELRLEVEKLFGLTAAAERFFAKAESQLTDVLALAPEPKD